jgi:hypothetical protein
LSLNDLKYKILVSFNYIEDLKLINLK